MQQKTKIVIVKKGDADRRALSIAARDAFMNGTKTFYFSKDNKR